ncbi:MAG: hypothetical protein LDLANPLL_02773 [Turneriella sp.]|nr:hypothetical protein [Turneriella sp.]
MRRKDALTINVPIRMQQDKSIPLTVREMKEFTTLARQGAINDAIDIRIHAHMQRFFAHAAYKGAIASRVAQGLGELRAILTRWKMKYKKIHITLIDTDLANAVAIFRFGLNHGIYFELERVFDLRIERVREIREVLVLTNIADNNLQALQTNLPFWSKGIPGFRFRHIFGALTKKRVENILANKAWDLVIYRGHATVDKASINWRLSDGTWKVIPLGHSLYFHLSCIPEAEKLRIEKLPSTQLLAPLSPIEDFDDVPLVETFLERYKFSNSIRSAVRSIQDKFPQFLFFSLSA